MSLRSSSRSTWVGDAVMPLAVFAAIFALRGEATAQDNYKATGSDRTYSHWIELKDAAGRHVDPHAADAAPFSMQATCKTCHDLGAMAHGWHFAPRDGEVDRGRNGEPWILTDPRTGTQLPLSYRGWSGTWNPDRIGLSPSDFLSAFGRHLPGGSREYAGAADDQARFRIGGALEIDCMVCHGRGSSWSHERWAKAVDAQLFAWAPGIALGWLSADGDLKSLPDTVDVSTPEGRASLPKTVYDPRHFAPDGRAFFDVVRTPENGACATCHGARPVGDGTEPRWLHDGDVHLRAGLRCADCHRNGLEHHTVRGFEGERNPSGVPVDSLTCRGCHTDSTDGHGNVTGRGGRLGAPRAEHRGLPLVHLEKMSCTACHSGERPSERTHRVQTPLAHALGVPSQIRTPADLPAIVEPILARDGAGVIRPVRRAWPSFWGWLENEVIEPILPNKAFATVRRALRVRKDLAAEIGDGPAAREKIAAGLIAFQAERTDAIAVFVTGGRAWRIGTDGKTIESFAHSAADAVDWPLAHDVRPARDALGAGGCVDCHAADSKIIHGSIQGHGLIVDAAHVPDSTQLAAMRLDPTLVAAWEQSFRGRDLFKLIGVVALGVVAVVLLLIWLGAFAGLTRRRAHEGAAR